ncbi:MAG: hypothetical protein ACRDJU_07650 [Actinomycetota bacterium]
MTSPARRRAERALRWYPQAWRERYGEEFVELLVSDIEERPRSLRRTLDLTRSGLLARSAQAGLGGMALDPQNAARGALAALGCALAVFLVFGGAMWAQLTTGGRWSRPAGPVLPLATATMSAALVVLAVLGLLAAAPVVWAAFQATGVAKRQGKVTVPLVLSAMAGAVLIAGSRHFANQWPGTGGHGLPHLGLIPSGVAAFVWAATLSITSYWAHLHSLSSFPGGEVAWMAISPVALVVLAAGVVAVVRRVDLPGSVVRYETALGHAAAAAALAFLLAASGWVAAGDVAAGSALHPGTIDLVGLVIVAAALAVARSAVNRTARAQRRLAAR